MKFAILNTCKSHLIFQTEKYLKRERGLPKFLRLFLQPNEGFSAWKRFKSNFDLKDEGGGKNLIIGSIESSCWGRCQISGNERVGKERLTRLTSDPNGRV